MQHPNHETIAAIAGHLDNTPEATAPHQWAGEQYTAPDGANIDRMYHHTDGTGITFAYSVWGYYHTTDIAVMVKRHGIEARVMVPSTYPAEVIANTAMVALRTTIDTLTTTAQGAAA